MQLNRDICIIDMEFPDYLKDREIKKVGPRATNSETELPFERIAPADFERFCCELVYKKALEPGNEVLDVFPIGVSGQKQYGADIFVREHSGSRDKFVLYEVKRVKSYSLSEYRKAVDRFLKNYDNWGFDVTEFNLFVSENISVEHIALWQSEAAKLSNKSISYKIIPSSTLNRWIKNFPELVYKYFHPSWTELLFGKSAIWHLENYGIFGFEEPASWIGYRGVEKHIYGDSLAYKNDHVRIHAFLPSLEKNSASCFIEFRNGRFSHVMITLDHRQIVKEYFSGAKIPIPNSTRPFLLRAVNGEGYFCDLGNCRIKLSANEAKSLCEAFDVFWEEYKRRVNDIEEAWRSKYFNCNSKSSEDIPLLRIKRGLWSLLLDFAECHDFFNTTGDWSLFDSCPGWLKIYTGNASKDMEAGYHAFIKPETYDRSITNLRCFDDEVVLVWQPPNDFIISQEGTIFSPRYYWDAETTHNWLKDHLIPQALEWGRGRSGGAKKRSFTGLLKDWRRQPKKYNPDDYVASFYEPYPNKDAKAIEDIEGLLFLANKLQSFFGSGPKNIFIDVECYSKLYSSLGEVLSKSEGCDFSYLHSNLNYLQANDMPSLIDAVRQHSIGARKGCANPFRIDCVFRCIQACIRDGRSHLNSHEVRNIINDIYPLIELMEDRKLLNRQSRFLCTLL